MNNEALLLKFLFRFPRTQLCRPGAGTGAGEHGAGLYRSHTLKGVAGNLSLEELHRQVSLQVET